MVLSLVTLAATVPLLATSTIQLQEQSQRKQDERELELKTEKSKLTARATKRMSSKRHEQLQGMRVVLHDGLLYLEEVTSPNHPFMGYFLPYPEREYDGIVSTIDTDNMLNWVFIDSSTYRVRHGVRADAQPHLTGPMSLLYCEQQDEWRVAFDGWEGFVAVQEEGRWAIYFDKDDNGLAGQVEDKNVVEIELVRSSLNEPDLGKEDVD